MQEEQRSKSDQGHVMLILISCFYIDEQQEEQSTNIDAKEEQRSKSDIGRPALRLRFCVCYKYDKPPVFHCVCYKSDKPPVFHLQTIPFKLSDQSSLSIAVPRVIKMTVHSRL
ncbi:hypothetical protein O6H91_02G108400 [Diphasiastrum complanatum]|uniref:Uncharacterized protein n=1 Tax=Diphasiastrum complanatum TaxID=34168 RepID=A0ACC2EJK7_DIPCM|nr:hypothetical protein O6H91_02G108400 [Diphasiastrum complanatum]